MVVGVGGYASGPMVLAAALGGRPTAILEQNSVPGFTNRMLGQVRAGGLRRVRAARSASFPPKKYRLVGNPVRRPVREALAGAAGDGTRDGDGVLVVGGSQGAHAVNELVVEAMKLLQGGRAGAAPGAPDRRDGSRGRSRSATPRPGIAADVRAFIDDMAAAYRGAALVVCPRRRLDARRADRARACRPC